MKRKAEEISVPATKNLMEFQQQTIGKRKRIENEDNERLSVSMEPPVLLEKKYGTTNVKAAESCTSETQVPFPEVCKEILSVDLCKNFDQETNMLRSIVTAKPKFHLPDPSKSGVDPDEYLLEMVHALWGAKLEVKNGNDLKDHFAVITENQMAAYNMTVVCATRLNQVDRLRILRNEKGRDTLNCFNRFGEGLLNMACRRGFKDIVSYLLSDDVHLDVRVRDDFGRTPMHDACWNPEPQLEICHRLMEKDPSLFLVADKRCFTPFQYARKSDWHVWRQFIFDRRNLLVKLMLPETLRKFSIVQKGRRFEEIVIEQHK